jgi:hypothetical protein
LARSVPSQSGNLLFESFFSPKATTILASQTVAIKNWIQGSIKHPGALNAQAKRAGMTVSQYISNPPKGITTTTKRRIAEAKTLRKLHK